MGNWLAYIALVAWPVVAVWLYRNKPATEATLWTILGGHLLLPVHTSIDFPMIPPLGKTTIPCLSAFIGCRIISRKTIPIMGPKGLARWFLLLYILAPFMTAELNSDPVVVGTLYLPGMTHYDALSSVINQIISILPFFIGRQLFRTFESHLQMFRILVVAGLAYSILMLFEVRMSPQLHTWVYGYFPHVFIQQARYGSFRPVVFIGHGLLVAFFAAICVIGAATLWQLKYKIRQFSPSVVTYYLLLVLVLCKSLASLLYGFFAFLLIKIINLKTQLLVAVLIVSTALLYPTMSITNFFPHDKILEMVEAIDPDRAQSMSVRFNNEHRLLAHTQEHFYFGWGSWGRNRIYDEETGEDETVTDGGWIITFSKSGWIGFLAEFALLSLPVFKSLAASKIVKSRQELITLASLSLIVSLSVIDQVPNSSLAPWIWLLVGMLLGRTEDILLRFRS